MELSKEYQDFKTACSVFVENNIKPYAFDHDKNEILSEQAMDALKKEGYLGITVPKQYGGLEFDSTYIGIVNEEIGRICSSTRSLLTVQGMVSLAILRWGTKEQKENWLPKIATGETICAFALTEPNIGSDAKNIESTVMKEESQYILNGKKKWITMGEIADLYLVFAKCYGKHSAFLVERSTDGLKIQAMKGMLGVKAGMLAELEFKNCKISAENILGNEGMGLSHIAIPALDYGRLTIAFGCVGMACACLNESVRYSRKRRQFESPIRTHQLIQKMITEMIVEVNASRLLCQEAASFRDYNPTNASMKIWIAKYHASKMAKLVTDYSLQILGANGCSDQYFIERFYRDTKINDIIEGTNQMHELLIAQSGIRDKY